MKKRHILLGLAMASTVLSLASCKPSGESATTEKVSTTTKTVATTTGDVTTTAIETTTDVVTTTEATTTEATTTEATTTEATTTEATTTEVTTTDVITTTEAPVETFTVTYVTAHGEAPASLTNVLALPVTLPTLTNDLYNFLGWSLTDGGTTLVTGGTAIKSNTTLYAVWQAKSYYDIISNNTAKVYSTDFSEGEVTAFSEDAYTTPGIYNKSEQTTALNVGITDGKLVGTDSDSTNPVDAVVSFGTLFEGVVEGCISYTPVNSESKTNGKWSIIQFLGQPEGNDDATLFSLRTSEDTSDQKILLYVNGAYVTSTGPTYTPGTEYEVYYKYDFSANSLTVKFGDTYIVENYQFDAGLRPVSMYGVRFVTAGKDTERSFKVDNFAVMETSKMALEDYKIYIKSRLDRVYNAINLDNYNLSKQYIIEQYELATNMITNAGTTKEAFDAFVSCDIYDPLDDESYKNMVINTLTTVKDSMADNYTYNATAYNSAYEAALKAIPSVTTIDQLNSLISTLNEALASIEDDATVRSNAVENLGKFVNELVSTLDETEDSSLIREIENAFETHLKILEESSMSEIDLAYSTAVDELQKIYDSGTMTLEELCTYYNSEITKAKNSAIDYFGDVTNYIDEVNDIALLNINNYFDKETLYNDYLSTISSIESLIASYDECLELIQSCYDYRDELIETLLIDTETYNSMYADFVDDIIDENYIFTSASPLSTVTDVKNDLLSAFDDIKAETEATVSFMLDQDTLYKTVNVLKNEVVSAPETTPTLTGFVFTGWNFDFNTQISDNTSIYALWHDTYGTDAVNTKSYDFTTLTTASDKKLNNVSYGDFIISKGEHSKFKENVGYISLYIGNTVKFTVTNDNAVFMMAYYSNNSSRFVTITSDDATYTETKYASNLTKGGSTYTYDGITITLEDSTKGWLIFEGLSKGSYTMTFGSDEESAATGKGEEKIERFKLLDGATHSKEVLSITAEVTYDLGVISVSDVTLNLSDETDVVLSSGYTLIVKLDGEEVDPNAITITDVYDVIVKYGSYTIFEIDLDVIVDELPE